MKIVLCAVGRLRGGPERDLVDDYTRRFDRLGRGLSLGPLDEREVPARPGAETAALAKAISPGVLCVLDERGRTTSSPQLARRLAGWRDGGAGAATFAIGGADGIAPDLREGADLVLSFGPMVWPHLLVRVMLTEQLYRAASILAGTPYHRE